MAQLVITAASTAVGFVLGGPTGARIGFALGQTLGGVVAASRRRADGPQLGDAQIVTSQYGAVVPYLLASDRVAGQVWWQSALRRNTSTQGGGKGGGPRVTTVTYSQDVLFGLTCNPKGALLRVWANGNLIWSALPDADPETVAASEDSPYWRRITYYSGAPDQLPDPVYEAAVGTADAPAYRGRATVFIEDLQLGNSGVLPNLMFELGDEVAAEELYLKDISDSDLTITSFTGNKPISGVARFNEAADFGAGGPGYYVTNSAASGRFADLPALTAEFCIYLTTASTLTRCIIGNRPEFGLDQGFRISIGGAVGPQAGPLIAGGYYDNQRLIGFNGGLDLVAADPFPMNQWVHVAFVANASNCTLYQDGVAVASRPTVAAAPAGSIGTSTGNLLIGRDVRAVGANFDGFLDEIRISSVSRYSGNFSVPTARFPDDSSTIFHWRCDALRFADQSTITLRRAVEDLCARAGMPAGTYDASALDAITQPVRGLVVGQVGATRATLEVLAAAYPFAAQLSDKLYFRPVPASPVATVPYGHLGAGRGQAQQEPLVLVQQSDLELPAQVVVRYTNILDDYQVGAESSDRLLSGQVAQQVLDLPLALEPAEAKAVADSTSMDSAAAQTTTDVWLPMAYAHVEAGDVLQVQQRDGSSLLLRLLNRNDDRAVLRFAARLHDTSTLSAPGITDVEYTPSAAVQPLAATAWLALDIPLLRDADDGPGYYVAAKPVGGSWPGGVVFSSINDADFTEVARVQEAAVFGVTSTVLPNFAGGFVRDAVSRVTVDVGRGELASATWDALFADSQINVLLVGDEIVRFATATLVSTAPNIYTVSNLLRGLQGTEWAMGTHAIGERVALLRPQGLRRVATGQPDVGTGRFLKGVTAGRALSTAESFAFTNTGVSQRPLAPVDIRVSRDTAGNFFVSWKRRSRRSSVLLSPQGVPLGEQSESYQVDIVSVPSGVVRATLSTSVAAVNVSIAQQVASAIASGDSIRFDVYQMSATVGRGRPGSALATANYVTQPQISQFELLGEFSEGLDLTVQLSRQGVTDTVTHVTTTGDATLAGAAASLAAAIDALSSYSATATGAVVQVTGPTSQPFGLLTFNELVMSVIDLSTVQQASPEVATSVDEQRTLAWETATGYSFSDLHQIRIQQISDNSVIDVFTSITSGTITPEAIAAGMSSAVNTNAALQALGIWGAVSGSNPRILLLSIPAALGGKYIVQRISTNPGIVSFTVEPFQAAQIAGPARPQISTAVIPAVTAGDNYILSIVNANQQLIVTADGSSTPASVAAELAALVDALPDFIGTSSGATVTITHASNNVPFVLAQAITSGSILLGFGSNIQAAQ